MGDPCVAIFVRRRRYYAALGMVQRLRKLHAEASIRAGVEE